MGGVRLLLEEQVFNAYYTTVGEEDGLESIFQTWINTLPIKDRECVRHA